MSRLRKNITIVVVTSLLWLGFSQPLPAEESERQLSVVYNAPRLSLKVQGANLPKVLREIGAKAGFGVVDFGASRTVLSLSMKDATLEEVLRRLLSGGSYTVIYREQGDGKVLTSGVIDKIFLLSPSTQTEAISDSGIRRQTEENRADTLLALGDPVRTLDLSPISHSTIALSGDAEPSRDWLTGEEGDEVRVEEILKVHAFSGLGESAEGSLSPGMAPSSVNQFLEKTAWPAGEGLTGDMPSPRLPMESHTALATTTRLAQQSLSALIDGLTTVESSLIHSLADKER